jgi:hypothetical protein
VPERLTVLLIAALLAALVGPAAAAERVLLDAKTAARRAKVKGNWSQRAGAVSPLQHRGFWLVDPGDGANDDGTYRFHVGNPHDGLDLTLLVRARPDRRVRRLDAAVGVQIRGRRAQLVSIRGGEVALLDERIQLRRSPRMTTLEIVVQVFGDRMVAHFIDPAEGRFLGTLLANDVPGGRGWVGVRGGTRWGQRVALTRLTARPPCDGMPPVEPDRAPLVVLMKPSDAAQATVHGRILEQLEGRPPRVAFRTDWIGLERLHCDRLPVLQMITRMPWKYLDRHYLTWRARPPEPTGRGVRIDRSYKNNEMVEAILRAYLHRFPERVRLATVGTSVEGRPIYAVAVANDIEHAGRRPTLLLNGAHHGDEPLSVEFVLDAVQQLLEAPPGDARTQRWLDSWVVWAVPLVNPDGNHYFLEESKDGARKNGRDLDRDGERDLRDGVDLNRNYPFYWGRLGERGSHSKPHSRYYRGPKPASEPETRGLMALADRERFAASVSYHTGTVALLAPYTIPRVEGPDPNEAWTVAEEIAAKLAEHPQQRPYKVRKNLYAVDGTDQDWHRFTHGTLALLVEGALYTPLDMTERSAIVAVTRPTWTVLLDRLLEGPSVSGFVTDAAGKPVHAEVEILEQPTRNKERWRTRCRDGRYDRYLPGPGTYTVRVNTPGMKPVQQRIEVEGAVRLDFRLPRGTGGTGTCP